MSFNAANQNSGAPKNEKLPDNYVDKAEEIMKALYDDIDKFKKRRINNITTSKLRNILSLAADTYNLENRRNETVLSTDSIYALQLMRIRLVYEYQRNNQDFQTFMNRAKLIEYLKAIGSSRKAFIDYYHYLEALVAFHRYFGGKEN